jgi:proliferating cell nuclear antigen
MEIAIDEEKGIEAFRNLVKLLKTVNEEQTLRLTREGIVVRTMDPGHVLMIDLAVKPGAFSKYDVPEATDEAPLVLTLNMKDLLSRFDAIEKTGEWVKFDFDAPNQMFNIHAVRAGGGRKRKFWLNVLEPTEEDVPTPKIRHTSSARMVLSEFHRAVKDAQMVAEHMVFELTKESVSFTARGDTGGASFEANKGSEGILDIASEADSRATFTVSTLADLMSALKDVAEVLSLHLSTDMPVQLTLEDPANLDCSLYLAPCIGV